MSDLRTAIGLAHAWFNPGQAYLTTVCDDRIQDGDLSAEGLAFWLYYYDKPRLLVLSRSRYQKALMRAASVGDEGIFALREGTPIESTIFDEIGTAFRVWRGR